MSEKPGDYGEPPPLLGFVCSSCEASGEFEVLETRPMVNAIRRRRQCLKCGKRVATVEIERKEWERLLRQVATLERLRETIRTIQEGFK